MPLSTQWLFCGSLSFIVKGSPSAQTKPEPLAEKTNIPLYRYFIILSLCVKYKYDSITAYIVVNK